MVRAPTGPVKSVEPHVNPDYPQPFENISLWVGLPGAVINAFLTSMLAMSAAWGNPMLAWLGIAALWTVYITVMGALWVGVASEG